MIEINGFIFIHYSEDLRFTQFLNVVDRVCATQLTFGAIFHIRNVLSEFDDAFQLIQCTVGH